MVTNLVQILKKCIPEEMFSWFSISCSHNHNRLLNLIDTTQCRLFYWDLCTSKINSSWLKTNKLKYKYHKPSAPVRQEPQPYKRHIRLESLLACWNTISCRSFCLVSLLLKRWLTTKDCLGLKDTSFFNIVSYKINTFCVWSLYYLVSTGLRTERDNKILKKGEKRKRFM